MNPASQPRIWSVVESVTNIVIGMVVALASQIVFFPLVLHIHPDLSANLLLTALFTAVSFVRSFGLRRLFNWIHSRKHGTV